ncbi:hypothetical protein ACPV5S_15565 [Vibrio astriarenae]
MEAVKIEFTRDDIKPLMEELFSLRAQITETETQLKPVKERKTQIENTLLGLLDVDEKIAHKEIGTISVKEEDVPQVDDWDAVYRYIHAEQAFYLLSRRLLAAPYRELLEQGQDVPGTSPTTVRKLSVRKA